MKKPILGISMGDPFGNGPEITVKALSDKTVYDRCRPLVVGDVSSMEYAARVARKVSGIGPFTRSARRALSTASSTSMIWALSSRRISPATAPTPSLLAWAPRPWAVRRLSSMW